MSTHASQPTEEHPARTNEGFNLVDDPWIPLRSVSGGPRQDVSLRDALVSAHEREGYPDDDGQFGPALLRLLTAFAYVVSPLGRCEDEDEFTETFSDLFDQGRFDADSVDRCLDRWKDKFWLFPPEGQIGDRWMQNNGISAAELAVPLVESGLVSHASPSYAWGNQKVEPVTCASAARHLLAFMHYGRGGGGLKHPAAGHQGGWQKGRLRGRISVHPIGASLFHTLLLQTVAPGDGRFDRIGQPEWETSVPAPSVPLAQPASLLEQLTGRWEKTVWLFRNSDGLVHKAALATGRRRPEGVTEADPYTAMCLIKRREDDQLVPAPLRSTPGKAVWRDLPSLRFQTETGQRETHILDSLNHRHERSHIRAWVLAAHRSDNAKDKGWDISMLSPKALLNPDVEAATERLVQFAGEVEKELKKQVRFFLNEAGCKQSPQKSRLRRAAYAFWADAETTYRQTIDRPGDTSRMETAIRHAALGAYEAAVADIGSSAAAKYRDKPDKPSEIVPVAAARERHRHELATAIRKRSETMQESEQSK